MGLDCCPNSRLRWVRARAMRQRPCARQAEGRVTHRWPAPHTRTVMEAAAVQGDVVQHPASLKCKEAVPGERRGFAVRAVARRPGFGTGSRGVGAEVAAPCAADAQLVATSAIKPAPNASFRWRVMFRTSELGSRISAVGGAEGPCESPRPTEPARRLRKPRSRRWTCAQRDSDGAAGRSSGTRVVPYMKLVIVLSPTATMASTRFSFVQPASKKACTRAGSTWPLSSVTS